MKRLLLMTILVLALTSLVGQGTPGLRFNLIDNGTAYEVGSDWAGAEHIEIPETYNCLPVTRIAAHGFSGYPTMTSITIPNSITSIGNFAFYLCRGLISVNIPESVISIGDGAFEDCGLTSIIIPESVISIGDYAFRNCTSLTSVTIQEGVTMIGLGMFFGCTSLTSVDIPNSVTTIGEAAFILCTSLTSIYIPNSVTSIGNYAFSDCTGLTSIDIPNSVTSIGTSAFEGCTGLTSIDIPNSVTSIGAAAFYVCTGLTSVTIPNSVTSIGDWAFAACINLTIYAEAESQPAGWHQSWNPDNRPVVWGFTIVIFDPVTNLVHNTTGFNVALNWDAPSTNHTFLGYKLLKNETVLAEIHNTTSFSDSGLSPGTYTYQVIAVYIGGESVPVSTTATVLAPQIALTQSSFDFGVQGINSETEREIGIIILFLI